MENNAPKKESTREKIGDGILTAVVEILLVVIVLALGCGLAALFGKLGILKSMSSNLLEWLGILALILSICIAGKIIQAKEKRKKEATKNHSDTAKK